VNVAPPLNRLFSDALASAARTVAGAKPELKLTVYRLQAGEVAGWVFAGQLDKALGVDALHEIADANGLLAEHGVDVITAIIAESFKAEAAVESERTDIAEPCANLRTVSQDVAAPRASKDCDRLVFEVVQDVAAARIDWVWPNRLAARKLTLVAGDPGMGKSQMTIDVVARISTGAMWPDGCGAAPFGSTIILSAEDSVSDTLRPRLEAAGADLKRVHVLRATVDKNGARRTFSLQGDLGLLGEKVKALGDVRLVVVDPITSYMGKVDSHRTSDVRAVLEPVAEFAERHNVSVLAVSHPPKATQAKAMHAITGSLAFVAAARLVFIAIEETDTDRRLLLPVKSNIGVLPPGIGFNIVSATTSCGIPTSRVSWSSEPVTITANQALHASAEGVKSDGQVREAEDFLRDVLRNGPVLAKDVEKDATEAGISKATLKRARGRLKVVAAKDGFKGGWTLRMSGAQP
jgi:hypothetical protein